MGDIAAASRLEEHTGPPFGPALCGFSVFYCMTTSLSPGGAGLGTVWGRETAERMLRDVGLGSIAIKSVDGDPVDAYAIATRRQSGLS
jgi:hypothetical protein